MIDPSTSVSTTARPNHLPVLMSGASFSGLATAFWMVKLGYRVTVIEAASSLRRGGTPVDIEGETIDILKRMGCSTPCAPRRCRHETSSSRARTTPPLAG